MLGNISLVLLFILTGGEGGIRTLAAQRKLRPTGLANPPLQPLEYLTVACSGPSVARYVKSRQRWACARTRPTILWTPAWRRAMAQVSSVANVVAMSSTNTTVFGTYVDPGARLKTPLSSECRSKTSRDFCARPILVR